MPRRKHDLVDQDGVRVQKERCTTCIFHPGNKMWLNPGRVKEMVEESLKIGGTIVCHDTLAGQKQNAICRGFFDSYKNQVPLLQVAERLNFIKEV